MKKNPNTPKVLKRKHMWWRYLIAFTGGMVFAVVGTAAGAIVASAFVPVSNLTSNVPEEYRSILSFLEDGDTIYSATMKFINQEVTVDDITQSVELPSLIPSSLVGEKLYTKLCFYETDGGVPSDRTFGDYLPKPSYTVEIPENYRPINLYMILNGRISPSDDTPFSFVENLTSRIVIADVVDEATIESSSLLTAVKDCNLGNIQETVMDVPLKDLMGGSSGIMEGFADLSINDLMADDATSKIYIADVLGVDQSSDKTLKLLAFFKDSDGNIDYDHKRTFADLDDLSSIIDTLYLKDIIEVDSSDPILSKLADCSIGNLSDRMANLKVSDIFPNSDNKLMNWLVTDGGDPKIHNIDTKIQDAPLGALLDVDNATGMAGGILKSLKDCKIGELATEFNKVKIVDAFASEIYDGDNIKPNWKYMLYADITNPTDDYKNYTLASFSALTVNMTNNMSKATLKMLCDDGFISGVDTNKLNIILPGQSKAVKDMTISEFINSVLA